MKNRDSEARIREDSEILIPPLKTELLNFRDNSDKYMTV